MSGSWFNQDSPDLSYACLIRLINSTGRWGKSLLEVKGLDQNLLNDLDLRKLRLGLLKWSDCKMGNFQESDSSDLFLILFCSNQ